MVNASIIRNLHDLGISQRRNEPTCTVAQASPPASPPGVPPGVRVGSETLPQLAAGADCATWFMKSAEAPVASARNPQSFP
jgi:hypothetical protein